MEVKPNLANIELAEVLGVGAALAEPKRVGLTEIAVVPGNWKLEDLTKFQPSPARAKGNVTLGDVESFIRYVNKHKDVAGDASEASTQAATTPADPDDMQTIILVDVKHSAFRAIFNHHACDAPGWGDFTASYDCPLSPEWVTWNAHSGDRMTQEKFAFFIEENQLDIVEPVGSTMLEIVSTLKSAKNVAFDSGLRLADGRVQIKYHEENNTTAGAAGQLTIPEKIGLGIPVYIGGQAYKVEAMFRYRIEGTRLSMWYDLVRPHKILEDALDKVKTQIGDGTKIKPYAVTEIPKA